ncbi:hypothetical protein GCM10007989_27170 [Devosia pacifica]|uniref:PH domain-containing protein n=1 Tax=Devosia pacifica TaxID=1335967 RepID=A0A918VUD6_9HYPH|nr:hypothetical protein [Devosia pacifica]GHA30059.1 hypothetical protein GCM10007989_27170 [Devosia pacifica]
MSAELGWKAVLPDQERLLWHARPSATIRMADFATARLPFGIVFTVFALFWMSMTAQMGRMGPAGGGLDLFPLFGVPFVLVGLYMAIGIPLWDAYERKNAWYALTDEAAYIATELFGRRSLKRYPISEMNALELEDGQQGTVWFNKHVEVHLRSRTYRRRASARQTYSTTTKVGFKYIDQPRIVYQLLIKQINRPDRAMAS